MAEDRAADVARAWKMRADGATQREIAAELGCSLGKANALVREAAEAETVIGSDDRSTGRIREAAALDAWQAKLEPLLGEDPLTAVPVLLKVSAARRALLGLDAPSKISISNERKPLEPMDPEIVAAVKRAQETAAREQENIRAGRNRDDDGAVSSGTP